MRLTWLFAVGAFVTASGCGKREERTSSTANGSAAGSGSSSAPVDAAVAIDPAMLAFCVRSMEQIKTCFEDEAFWDAHATTYFAAQKEPIEPERKKQWIGMYKDSFVSLVRAKELQQNCEVMLAQNQLPTQKQMDLVDQAREQSCVAFGGALGYILYSEGAFHRPRDGEMVPSTLDLSPPPPR
jgi:hypothetical protein